MITDPATTPQTAHQRTEGIKQGKQQERKQHLEKTLTKEAFSVTTFPFSPSIKTQPFAQTLPKEANSNHQAYNQNQQNVDTPTNQKKPYVQTIQKIYIIIYNNNIKILYNISPKAILIAHRSKNKITTAITKRIEKTNKTNLKRARPTGLAQKENKGRKGKERRRRRKKRYDKTKTQHIIK